LIFEVLKNPVFRYDEEGGIEQPTKHKKLKPETTTTITDSGLVRNKYKRLKQK
jgi:hypothetical protein